jgi:hypothetical protein
MLQMTRPLLVNEDAPLPKLNPFQELYLQQFGGSPSPADLNAMNPDKYLPPPSVPPTSASGRNSPVMPASHWVFPGRLSPPTTIHPPNVGWWRILNSATLSRD